MHDRPEILLATDFSARSDRALDRAVIVARERNARLVVVHVLEGKAKRDFQEDPDRLAAHLRAELPESAADAELVLRTGSTPEVLASLVRERGSSLMVTGVARFNSIGDYLIGTAVEHIISETDAPVLVVRKRARAAYARILAAIDFSPCSRAALAFVGAFFPGAAIEAVNAFHVPYEGWLKSDETREVVRAEHVARMTAFLDDAGLTEQVRARITPVVQEGDPGAVICRRLEQGNAELLVLGRDNPHSSSGILESLLTAAACDVLAVRNLK